MKKTIIGSVLLFAGVLQTIGIIISGTLYLTINTAWSKAYSSKLFFAIFAGNSKYDDGANGLGLGFLFLSGIIMIFIGLVILITEYLKEKTKTISE